MKKYINVSETIDLNGVSVENAIEKLTPYIGLNASIDIDYEEHEFEINYRRLETDAEEFERNMKLIQREKERKIHTERIERLKAKFGE